MFKNILIIGFGMIGHLTILIIIGVGIVGIIGIDLITFMDGTVLIDLGIIGIKDHLIIKAIMLFIMQVEEVV